MTLQRPARRARLLRWHAAGMAGLLSVLIPGLDDAASQQPEPTSTAQSQQAQSPESQQAPRDASQRAVAPASPSAPSPTPGRPTSAAADPPSGTEQQPSPAPEDPSATGAAPSAVAPPPSGQLPTPQPPPAQRPNQQQPAPSTSATKGPVQRGDIQRGQPLPVAPEPDPELGQRVQDTDPLLQAGRLFNETATKVQLGPFSYDGIVTANLGGEQVDLLKLTVTGDIVLQDLVVTAPLGNGKTLQITAGDGQMTVERGTPENPTTLYVKQISGLLFGLAPIVLNTTTILLLGPLLPLFSQGITLTNVRGSLLQRTPQVVVPGSHVRLT